MNLTPPIPDEDLTEVYEMQADAARKLMSCTSPYAEAARNYFRISELPLEVQALLKADQQALVSGTEPLELM